MQSADDVDMEMDEMNLLDFPDEILLEIFRNFNDNSLLQAIGVCRKFQHLAVASFERRYNGTSEDKFYSLKIAGENFIDECKQYQPLFRHFGGNIKAISITFRDDFIVTDHWLIPFIRRYCNSITKLNISHGKGVDLFKIISLMPHLMQLSLKKVTFLSHKWTEYTYPTLVHFSGTDSSGNHDAFDVFVRRNPQLEDISLIRFIVRTNNILCTMSSTLKKLNNLTLMGERPAFIKPATFSALDTLKSFTVALNKDSFGPMLTTIVGGLKSIENLAIFVRGRYNLTVDDINLLGSFHTLKTLKLQDAFGLPFDVLKTLMARLPNLTTFSLGDVGDLYRTPDDILNVVYVCRKLAQLELHCRDSPKMIYEFCQRFADLMEINCCNLKLVLVSDVRGKMTFTRDEARQYVYQFRPDAVTFYRILYWKGYDAVNLTNKNLFELNEKILQKIARFLNADALAALLQTCQRGQQLAIDYLNVRKMHCTVSPSQPTEESLFTVLGQYVRRIEVDLDVDLGRDEDEDETDETTETYQLKTKFLKCVNRYCGNVLTEMKITGSVPIKTVFHWPNLKKLDLEQITLENVHFFQCPHLTHLIISQLEGRVGAGSYMDSFPNLTSLCIGDYNDAVEAFLNGLDRRICTQMKDLYLEGSFEEDSYHHWLKLTNVVVQFNRLTALHLHIEGIEKSNFQFLFENSLMLEELTISFTKSYYLISIPLNILRTIKRNCKHIRVIRFAGNHSYFVHLKLDLKAIAPELTFENS